MKTLECRFVPGDWVVMEESTQIVKITQVIFEPGMNQSEELLVKYLCKTDSGEETSRPVHEGDLFNPDEWLRVRLARNRDEAREIRRIGKHLAAMIDRKNSLRDLGEK